MHLKLPKFNFSTAPKVENVFAIGGGPSSSNVDRINGIINKYECTVFAANYNYNVIKCDYLYFGDPNRFKRQLHNASAKNIILSQKILKRMSEIPPELSQHNLFAIGNPKKHHAADIKKWVLTTEGDYPYCQISPSGIANIACAAVCRPKRMFIVGMDGPENPQKGKSLFKYKFNGKKRPYRYESYELKREWLEKRMLPLLKRMGIEVYCLKESAFWQINKNKVGVINV